MVDSSVAQLYERRLLVGAKLKYEFQLNAVKVVKMLGVDGMSSDESDHESGEGEATYFASCKHWRSAEVTQYLHTLDAWHLRERYGGRFQATSGAWPHFRSPDPKISEREPVNKLPRNFYNAAWWKGISAFEKGNIDCSEGTSNLRLPAAVIK